MGTRADFYVGKGSEAKWIGSIAWDGYREGIPEPILKATIEEAYRDAVSAFLAIRNDATIPEQGWPWPWPDSGTTDCSYWFFDHCVWEEYHGLYFPVFEEYEEYPRDNNALQLEPIVFPCMEQRQNITMGERSGLTILRVRL